MANWCSSTIKFYSKDESEIRKMFDKFSEIYNSEPQVKNSFGHGFMGDYARAFFPEMELEKIRCRGSIDMGDEVSNIGEYYCFSIFAVTANSPLIGLWYNIVKKFYKKVRIAYIAEECSNGIFRKWDETEELLFFPDTFYIDGCLPTKDGKCEYIDDRYQFGTVDEILKYLDERLPFKYDHKENLDDLTEEVQTKLDSCSDGAEYEEELYVQIAEFSEVSPADYNMYQ